MNLPKKISPDPIVDAIAEIRFDINIVKDAVFGIIYNELKDRYPKIDKLPILQIPEILRNRDANYSIMPYYKIYNDKFNIQIGPEMCSVSINGEYPGWTLFLEEILYVFNKVKELKIINKIKRLGLRYIDFFEDNIYGNIKVDIIINKEKKDKNKLYLRIDEEYEKFNMKFQIRNEAVIIKDNKKTEGSIIDVDTVMKNIDNDFFEKLKDNLDEAHSISKKYYFNMLKEEFLKSLKPIY